MDFRFYLYSAGAYRDISDYVINSSLIPFIDRNRDFSLRSSPINFDLFDTSPYIPGPGDKLKVEYIGTVVFIGRVKKAKHVRDQNIYKTEVLNRLSDLQNYLVDWDTLQSDLYNNADTVVLSSFPVSSVDIINQRMTSVGHGASSGQTISFSTTGTLPTGLKLYRTYWIKVIDANTLEIYANSTLTILAGFTSGGTGTITISVITINRDKYASYDNEGYDNIKISYLIDRMFVIAGFTLTSNLATATIGTFTKSGADRIYTGDDFRIDLSAMYSINQPSARDSRYTDASLWVDRGLKITFFDFISIVHKSMGAFLVPSGDDAFTNYHAPTVGETYTISNDDQYGYADTDVAAEYKDYSFKVDYGNTASYRSAYYQDTSLSIFEALKKGDGANKITWYSNLAFLFEDKDGAAGDVEPNDFWDVTSLGVGGTNKIFTRHMLTNYKQEEFETNVTTTIKGVVENYLNPNVKEEVSRILQEVYT